METVTFIQSANLKIVLYVLSNRQFPAYYIIADKNYINTHVGERLVSKSQSL